ncbi:MAG TPA: hypothetical protein VF121_00450 [Thermoanaerobaculia bacterium]|nr:hypothetical protein [Thermoanaerobaculia bacterium]
MKVTPFKLFLGLLYITAFGAIFSFYLEGRSFYGTPLLERPRHADFWALKPGGFRGHAFGVVGSSLMVLMLLYSARKRVRALRGLGRLREWLDLHIFCGVIGPLLVVLHSSFKVQGLVALSFWSMIAVALSGVLGRYLYLQIPRTRAGDALTLAETEGLHRDLTRRLREELGLGEERLAELDRIALAGTTPTAGVGRLLLALPFQSIALRWRLRAFARRLRRELRDAPPRLLREVGRTARQKAVLERRLVLWSRLQQLFHYWHVVHKPFAVVMYLFMVVHVATALLTGYGWRPGR